MTRNLSGELTSRGEMFCRGARWVLPGDEAAVVAGLVTFSLPVLSTAIIPACSELAIRY
jgi:hypothetical protein